MGGPFFLPAQGNTGNWTFNNASLFFKNDHRYDITAKATDNAGNSNTITNRFCLRCRGTDIDHDAVPAIPYFHVAARRFQDPSRITRAEAFTAIPRASRHPACKVAVKLVGGNWWNGTSNQFNGSDPDYSYFAVANTTTSTPNSWT